MMLELDEIFYHMHVYMHAMMVYVYYVLAKCESGLVAILL